MANYRDAVLCKNGQKLLKMALSGEAKINFTSVKTSTTKYTESQLEGLTDIGEIKQSVGIAASTEDSPNTISLYAAVTNAKLTEGYYVRNFGIYATDPADEHGEKELLYAVINADESEIPAAFIPAYNNKGTSGLDFSCEIIVDDSSEVTITLEENVDVPLSVFNNFVERFNSFMKEFNTLKQKFPLKPESIKPSSVADRVMVTVKNGNNTEVKWSQIFNNMIAKGTIELDRLVSGVEISKMLDGYLPMFTTPEPKEGWQCNWLFDTGWYLGGIKKDCGGHPPVLNNNQTSWAVLVLNGMATDANSLNHNHRLQIAWDLVNSKCYMRRGWMSENTWADKWEDVGKIANGSITESMLNSALQGRLNAMTAHISDTSNPHGVTAVKIGLGNVDNTSDSNKPISNPQIEYIKRYEKSFSARLLGYTEWDVSSEADDVCTALPNAEKIVINSRDSTSTHIVFSGSNITSEGAPHDVRIANNSGDTIIVELAGIMTGSAGVPEQTYNSIALEDGYYMDVHGDRGSNPPIPAYGQTGSGVFDPTAELATKLEKYATPSAERLAAIEQKLNGISFDMDSSGHLTYEKQPEATT